MAPSSTPVHTISFTAEHEAMLIKQAIQPAVAEAAGVRSVLTREALPEELQWAFVEGGGVLYAHHLLSGETVYQFRADQPLDPANKYLFAKGASTDPSVHPSQAHLVGVADKVTIVEGTKQFLAAVSWAPADTLVIGIAGCTGGVSNGLHSPDFGKMIKPGAEVTIIFDADIATNRNVYDAGSKLRDHLLGRRVKAASVNFATFTAFGSAGLDDYLGVFPEAERTAEMEAMVAEAGDLPKRAPAKKAAPRKQDASAGLPVVDIVRGVIKREVVEAYKDGKPITSTQIILAAAPRITATYSILNDLDPDNPQILEYDMEIYLEVDGAVKRFTVEHVSANGFEKPRNWLNLIPGGHGGNIVTYQRDEEDIVAAVRACSNQDLLVKNMRTGLYECADGVVRYLDTKGGIGPNGRDESVRAVIAEEAMKDFWLRDVTELDAQEIAEGFNSMLEAWQLLKDPTAYILTLGATTAALMGLEPKGTFGGMGEPGSGKTTIIEQVLALLGPKANFCTFEDSPGKVAVMGATCHHLPIFADDLQTQETPKQALEQVRGVNQVIRRGYGGSKYGRNRLMKDNASGRFITDSADPSSPHPILTAERGALPHGRASTMDRMLLGHVTYENSFNEGGVAKFEKLIKSGRPHIAGSALVHRAVSRINDGRKAWGTGMRDIEGIEGWYEHVEEMRRGEQEKIKFWTDGKYKARRNEVASTALVGVRTFLEAAYEAFEAAGWEFEQGEFSDWMEQVRDRVAGAMEYWDKVIMGTVNNSGGRAATILGKLTDKVASGEYSIAKNKAASEAAIMTGNRKMLGWFVTYQGKRCVALLKDIAPKAAEVTVPVFQVELADVLQQDKRGNRTVVVSQRRMFLIPEEIWMGQETDDQAEVEEDEDF